VNKHTGGMKVSNYRFKELLENKLGNSKPLVEQFYDEDDTDFEDEELYSGAPERLVKHMDSGKIVGTHKHGVGYTPNKHGIRLGHSSHPTSIPNFTKFDDEDDYDFEGNVETHLESRTKRNYLINEQTTTGTTQTTTGTTPQPLKRAPQRLNYNVSGDEFLRYFEYLGGVKITQKSPNESFIFKDKKGKIFSVSKEWVMNEENVNDQPEFLDPSGNGEVSDKFRYLFDNRIKF